MTLEIDIEKEFCKRAIKEFGAWAIKFKHVGIKGAPDRMVFCPNNHVFFIEFKYGDNQPSVHQEQFAKTLAKLDFNVYFCWSVKDAILALEKEIKRSLER